MNPGAAAVNFRPTAGAHGARVRPARPAHVPPDSGRAFLKQPRRVPISVGVLPSADTLVEMTISSDTLCGVRVVRAGDGSLTLSLAVAEMPPRDAPVTRATLPARGVSSIGPIPSAALPAKGAGGGPTEAGRAEGRGA